MKYFLLFQVFIFCELVSYSQIPYETKSGLIPGNELNIDPTSSVLYDSLVVYAFATENDSEYYSKIIYQYNDIPKLSGKFSYQWNKVNNSWRNNQKSEYAWDSKGRNILEAHYQWNIVTNDQWYGIYKKVYAYDAAGNIVLYEEYPDYDTVVTNTWVGETKYEAVFGSEEQILSKTYYGWYAIWHNGEYIRMWSPSSKEEDRYNEKGAIDSIIFYTWNITDSVFYKSEQKAYSYDPSDSLAVITDITFDLEGNPYNNYKEEYTYDTTSDTTSVIFVSFNWDNTIHEWIQYYKFEKERNAHGKVILEISYMDVPGFDGWQPGAKNEYTYDEMDNEESISSYYFSDALNGWKGTVRLEFQYDDQNRRIKQVHKEWNEEINDWEERVVFETSWDMNGDISMDAYYSYKYGYGNKIENVYNEDGIVTSYNEYTGTPDNWSLYAKGYYYRTPGIASEMQDPLQSDKLSVYPNPVTGKIRIDGLTERSMLYIYDTQGQLVFSLQIENNEEIDLGHLPAGLYLTRINSPSGTHKGKFVKRL